MSNPNADYGRCDTCGAPCDSEGCTQDRAHEIALDVDGHPATRPEQIDSYPTCAEGDHPNDDNPGKPMCKTCEDWHVGDDHRYNSAPFCAKCGGPCLMGES